MKKSKTLKEKRRMLKLAKAMLIPFRCSGCEYNENGEMIVWIGDRCYLYKLFIQQWNKYKGKIPEEWMRNNKLL